MKVAILSMMAVAAAGSVAHAEDEPYLQDSGDDEFISLGAATQVGLGAIRHTDDTTDFDGTFRISKVWRASKHLHPGGFLEFHTVDFDHYDVAVGPQIQFQLGENAALQLRAGVGAVDNGKPYAVVGAQFGNFLTGLTVTARRPFDGGPTEFSANVELTTALVFVPLFLAGGGFPAGAASEH